jgi:hypothetical protein
LFNFGPDINKVVKMAAVAHPSLFASVGVGMIVLWRVYYRMRRMIGRQKLSSVRPWITVSIFPLLVLLLLLSAVAHPGSALALLVGVLGGVALGIYGLRLTKFEQNSEGYFYTPSAHLGIALSLLLLARLGYRMVQLFMLTGEAGINSPGDLTRSPLTILIFGTLAGYYVTYAVGLLRWRRGARDTASIPDSGT